MSIASFFRKIRSRGDASKPIKHVNEALNEAREDAPVVPERVKKTPKSDIGEGVMSKNSSSVNLPPVTHPAPGGLTLRGHMEVITHEAIVLEAYKCSRGMWTWGVGVTNQSGHQVHPRYLRNPQSITRVLEVYEWLVRKKYLPEVRAAFGRMELNEHQIAAALSFHWNTGGIARASWVRSFRDGKIEQAKREFMQWRKPPEIIKRREAERDLFFDGKWTNRGTRARIIHRVASNGNPIWSSAVMTDIGDELRDVLARAG
jgi:lysozyme